MKFAMNFSRPAAALLQAGRIKLDYFKTPNWPDLVAEARAYLPVAVHFNLQAGKGNLQATNWAAVEAFLDQTGTRYVNLHLNPELDDFPGFDVERLSAQQQQRVLEVMLADVQAVVHHFGPERVIAENIPYRGRQGRLLRPAVEPEVICQIVEATGCGLLLDVSHARIAAASLEMDPYEYMEKLPVGRLRELHFTGLHCIDGQLRDHLPVLDSDWPVLAWVLERIQNGEWARPWMLAFEYGGVGGFFGDKTDPEIIASQVPELYAQVGPI